MKSCSAITGHDLFRISDQPRGTTVDSVKVGCYDCVRMNTAPMQTEQDEDLNVVEIWLRRDPVRWIAGALAGLFAGLVAAGFGMIFATVMGADVFYPIKWMAIPVLGNSAMLFGFNLPALIVGLVVLEAVCLVQGVVYAHMTGTNSLSALLGVGLVFGILTWIFIINLYMPAFAAIRAVNLPSSAAFPVCLVMGLSLTSVAFFDRMVRGRAI